MLSIQANIVLQLIDTLSTAEILELEKEFSKRLKQITNSMPENKKNHKKINVNDLANQILANHRQKQYIKQV
jgi:hypothetical protein